MYMNNQWTTSPCKKAGLQSHPLYTGHVHTWSRKGSQASSCPERLFSSISRANAWKWSACAKIRLFYIWHHDLVYEQSIHQKTACLDVMQSHLLCRTCIGQASSVVLGWPSHARKTVRWLALSNCPCLLDLLQEALEAWHNTYWLCKEICFSW